MKRDVVTAQMLQDLRRTGRPIVLSRDALLTPAARDWLRENAARVEWQDRITDAGGGRSGKLQAVIDLASPAQRSLLASLERSFGTIETIDPSEKAGGLIPAVRRLCGAILSRQSGRGLVLADDGALPVCVANKFARIRAALGTGPAAVEQAVRQFGINVLVIEPSKQTIHQIRQMVDRFVALKPSDAAEKTIEAISTLEGEGRANR